MKFFDYYENIEEIDPSYSREANLKRLRKALRIWRKRQGDEARITENYINRALEVFSDPKKYDDFCQWYQERQEGKTEISPEEEFRGLVHGSALDGIITPAEYQMLLGEAKRKGIPKGDAENIIQRIADEHGATIGEVETQPSGVPVLEVDCEYMNFENIKIGTSLFKSFTLSNVGGGTLRGTISALQPWIKVLDRIDPTKHKQQAVVTIDTTNLMPGFISTDVINVKTNGGNAQITVKLSTEGHESVLERFSTNLSIAIVFAGAALGALFGMLGSGGAMLTFFILLGAIVYGLYLVCHNLFRGSISAGIGLSLLYTILAFEILGFFGDSGWDIAAGVGLGFLFAVIYWFVSIYSPYDEDEIGIEGGACWLMGLLLIGLAALSDYAPVAGGIVCGISASVLFTWFFSERLFDYQCSNLAISPASSGIIDFKRQIVRSTAIVAGMLMVLAICAAISVIAFIVVVIIIVVAIIITQQSNIKDKFRL
jgi:hypothetical protein